MKFVCNLKMWLNNKYQYVLVCFQYVWVYTQYEYVLVIVAFFLSIFKQLMIAKMDHRRKLKLH